MIIKIPPKIEKSGEPILSALKHEKSGKGDGHCIFIR